MNKDSCNKIICIVQYSNDLQYDNIKTTNCKIWMQYQIIVPSFPQKQKVSPKSSTTSAAFFVTSKRYSISLTSLGSTHPSQLAISRKSSFEYCLCSSLNFGRNGQNQWSNQYKLLNVRYFDKSKIMNKKNVSIVVVTKSRNIGE